MKNKKENLTGYLFILPAIILFFTFVLIPVIVMVCLGFTKYNLFSACEKSDLEKHLIIEPYRYDYRINWDTYIVYLPDQGILGFTDGPVE